MISNKLSGVKAFLRCKTCRNVDFFGPPGHFPKKKGNEEIVFEPSQKVQAALKFWSYLCSKPFFDGNTLTLALSLFVCIYVWETLRQHCPSARPGANVVRSSKHFSLRQLLVIKQKRVQKATSIGLSWGHNGRTSLWHWALSLYLTQWYWYSRLLSSPLQNANRENRHCHGNLP